MDSKLSSKKISKEMYGEKLLQFENIIEGQIDNEIAKAIERAHPYHFNLQNYRSNLSDEQIKDWQETLTGVEIKNGSKIEKRYQELQKAEPKTALQILASFDPKDALQMDIGREYLSKLDKKVLEKDEKLKKLEEILRKGFQYPLVTIEETCKIIKGSFPTQKTNEGQYPLVVTAEGRLSADGYDIDGHAVCVPLVSSTGHGHASIKRLHYQKGKFALANIMCAIIPQNPNELSAHYLYYVLNHRKDNLIVPLMTGAANVSLKPDNLLKLAFPIPSPDVQKQIVEEIEKQKQIIEGADRIDKGWFIPDDIFIGDKKIVSEIATVKGGKRVPNGYSFEDSKTDFPYIRVADFSNFTIRKDDLKYLNESIQKQISNYTISDKDIYISIAGSLGQVGIVPSELNGANLTENAAKIIIFNENEIDRKYLMYQLSCGKVQKLIDKFRVGVGTPKLPLYVIEKLEVFLPPLESQRQIVEKLDRQMQALEGVRMLKAEAQKRIEEILAGVWGE